MNSADSRGFLSALIGDGRSLILFTAITLLFSGGGAIFLSVTGHFLPHDVEFLGMQPEDEFHDLFPGSGAVTEAHRAWLEAKRGNHQFGMFGEAA